MKVYSYGVLQSLFPSSQSTYSTEPRRNLNGIGSFLPQSCSTRQKKGNSSGVHFGNIFPASGSDERRGENRSGRAKECIGIKRLFGLWERSVPASESDKHKVRDGVLPILQARVHAPWANILQGKHPKRRRKNGHFIMRRRILVRQRWLY